MAAGFKDTRAFNLGATFIFSPHIGNMLKGTSLIKDCPSLTIPDTYDAEQAIHRFIERLTKSLLELAIITPLNTAIRDWPAATPDTDWRQKRQAFASQHRVVISPILDTPDHRYFAEKLAEQLDQEKLLEVIYQPNPVQIAFVQSNMMQSPEPPAGNVTAGQRSWTLIHDTVDDLGRDLREQPPRVPQVS